MAHISQRIKSGTLAKFDYHRHNQEIYGKPSPPIYNISKITSPNIILVSGENDLMADVTDLNRLRKEFQGMTV